MSIGETPLVDQLPSIVTIYLATLRDCASSRSLLQRKFSSVDFDNRSEVVALIGQTRKMAPKSGAKVASYQYQALDPARRQFRLYRRLNSGEASLNVSDIEKLLLKRRYHIPGALLHQRIAFTLGTQS